MDSPQRSLTPSYSQENIREILNIALADRSTLDNDLPHSQLLEIAQELSISPEKIELAKNQWLDRQQVIKKHQDFALYRRSKLQDRLGKYAIVNACLIPLNFFTGIGVPWSLYVLTSWGIVRGVAAWRVFVQRQGYASIIVWVRHLRSCSGVVVFPRRTFGLYLVWQGTEKLKQQSLSLQKAIVPTAECGC